MKKYLAYATFPDDLVPWFVAHLMLSSEKLEWETDDDFICRKLKEHVNSFSTQWANQRVQELAQIYRQNLEEQIVRPIEDSTIIEVQNV